MVQLSHPYMTTGKTMKVKVIVAQLCPTLSDPMNCSLPSSSVHGILQARILQWVAILFSRGSSWSRDQTQVSSTASRFFTIWTTGEALTTWTFVGKVMSLLCNTLSRFIIAFLPRSKWSKGEFFKFTIKSRGRSRDFPHTPPPLSIIPWQNGACFNRDEPMPITQTPSSKSSFSVLYIQGFWTNVWWL